jgi:hypothetical protein
MYVVHCLLKSNDIVICAASQAAPTFPSLSIDHYGQRFRATTINSHAI